MEWRLTNDEIMANQDGHRRCDDNSHAIARTQARKLAKWIVGHSIISVDSYGVLTMVFHCTSKEWEVMKTEG